MIKDKTSINQTYGIYDNDAGGYVGGGKAAGTMTSVGIDTSGRLVASYSNGDTKYVGQIAVTEFTNMITTQRGYQANSRIITVSDTLLDELINLKR